jgi:RHS repeat-associated protein
MLMPKRSYSAAGSYRYGFNGKENDNDVKGLGNQQDYGMRIYDARVGRFLSVDPLNKEFPWNSSYSFAENDVIRSIDLEGAERMVRTVSFSKGESGKTVITISDNMHHCPTDGRYQHIHPLGIPPTDKQLAATNAILYQSIPKPGNGIFQFYEFAPEYGIENFADYFYTDDQGNSQRQRFSASEIQFRFIEIEEAKVQQSKNYNLAAALINLVGAGWLAKTELQAASSEIKAGINAPESKFIGGAKGDLYSKQKILEGNHLPTMKGMELAGFQIEYKAGSAFQMLYEEHRAFISTGSGKIADAFRKAEANLLSEGKFLEAFDLNVDRVRAAYGNKYNEAMSEAREYYQSNIIPQLQKQLQQKK